MGTLAHKVSSWSLTICQAMAGLATRVQCKPGNHAACAKPAPPLLTNHSPATSPACDCSLSWFIGLFVRAITNSARSDALPRRLEAINSLFTYMLYSNVCRRVACICGVQMHFGTWRGGPVHH